LQLKKQTIEAIELDRPTTNWAGLPYSINSNLHIAMCTPYDLGSKNMFFINKISSH
jgi:hypothetical protein